MSGRLSGRVAVVTGGASGIGLATARRFVAEGASVVVGDIDVDAANAAVADLGDAAVAARCDVTVEDDVDLLATTAVDRFGRLDVAFANAGIGSLGLVLDADVTEWRRVVDVNLVGALLTVRHAARRMTVGGSIVITASLNAVQAAKAMSAYCAAKAGAAMLAQVAALELGGRGIRVNAIGPGLVRTGLTDLMWAVPGLVDEYVENAPLGRESTADEIAAVVAFLASDDAATITGTLQLVDGGAHTMRYPDIPTRLGMKPAGA